MSAADPVTPKPSATIVVAREGPEAPEILLVRRRAGDAFGDSYTFPGGVIDPDEETAQVFCAGLSPDEANTILGLAEGGLDYYSAVIRELFEETGILLARNEMGEWVGQPDRFAEERKDVDKGRLPWPVFLKRHGLCMAVEALHYFAWWETPPTEPKRWTTRFFVAALPPDQEARHDGYEMTDSKWLSARDAVELRKARDIPMPMATFRNLKLMTDFESVDALIGWARHRHHDGIIRFTPTPIQVDGREKWVIPGDPGFPESRLP
jgi:8-oxo-dGTP pyrophosphatase MutT (NUDIX family)